jgi:outer membrane protein assembly complex protein YaeT
MKKRLRRILRISGWIIAGLILFSVLIHTPPLRSVVRGILTRTVGKKIEGQVTIGRLNYQLWRGRAEVENIGLEMPGFQIKVDRADVSFIPGRGISAKADRPTVVLQPQTEKSKTEKGEKEPSRFWTILTQFETVEVDEGQFELQSGSIDLKVQGSLKIERRIIEEMPERQSWVVEGDVRGSLNESDPIPVSVKSILGLKDGHLHLTQAQIETDHASLSADGIFYQTGPFEANFSGSFHAEDDLARTLALKFPVKGTAEGRFQFKARDSGIESHVEVKLPQIFFAESGPWEITAKSSFDGEVFRLDEFAMNGYGGSIDAQGNLELNAMKLDARVKASGLDPNSLVSTWAELPFPVSTQIGADVQLSLDNWQINTGKAEGVIRLDSLRTEGTPLSGDVVVELAKEELNFSSKSLKVFDSDINFSGKYRSQNLRTKYTIKAPASDIFALFASFKIPLPQVRTSGYIDLSGEMETEFQNLTATARLQSRELRVESNEIKVLADLQLNQGSLQINRAEIVSDPGRMEIQGIIPLADISAQWDLSAKLDSFDLSALAEKYGFNVSSDGIIQVQGPAKNPRWSTDLQLSLKNTAHSTQEGRVSFKAHEKDKILTVEELKLDLDQGSLVGSGAYQRETGEIRGQMSGFGFQLSEILSYINVDRDVNGVISLDADIQGTMSAPNFRLNLNTNGLAYKESPLPDLAFSVSSEGNTAEIKGLFTAEQFLSGTCQLNESFPLELTLDFSKVPLNEVLTGFPKLSPFQFKSANGQIQMTVPLRDFKALSYQAEVESIEGAYHERHFKISAFKTEGDLRSLLVSGFKVTTERGAFQLDGRFPLNQENQFDATIKGLMDFEPVSQFIPEMSLNGEAEINLQILGTFKQPQFFGNAVISKCHGRWQNVIWENLELEITSTEDGLQLKTLSVMALAGSLRASGRMHWADTGLESNVSFEFTDLNVGSLLAGEAGKGAPSMQISGRGELAATKLTLAALVGSGQISSITTNLGEPPIALQNPVNWNLTNGYLSHSPVKLLGKNTDLTLSFEFDGSKKPVDWQAKAHGNLNPELGSFWIDRRILRLSGKTQVDIDLQNQSGILSGQATLDGGRISLIDPPISISRIRAQISIQENNIQISELKGQVGTGEINLSGQIVFNETGSLPEVNMQLVADNIPINLSEGVYLQLSGALRFSGDESYIISGNVQIPRILVSQEPAPGVESLAYLERQMKSLEAPTLLDRIVLDISADVAELQINTKRARLSAVGKFTVAGSPSTPELTGSIRLNQGGFFQLQRARVLISEGSVALDNFPDQQPEINISGFSRVSGIYIEMVVRGRLDNLQIELVAPSRSDLTQGDLVMLLMTGRTSSEAVSSAGTVATEELAASLGGLLQEQVGEKVYIDVSPDQSFFSYDSDPTTRFSLGHQVAPNLYVIYSTALGGTQRRGILDYDTRRRFRLRYIYEEDGRNILEVTHGLSIYLRKKQVQETFVKQTKRRINSVSFEGQSPLDFPELLKTASLKQGKRYDQWNAYKGTERIQEKLAKLGYKSAVVNFEERQSSPEKVDVVYFLETGKKINIVWKGDVPNRRLRKRIEALWDGRIPEDALPGILAKQTQYALQAQKYYLAQVEPQVTSTDEAKTVELKVTQGPRGQKLRVNFEGNESLPDEKLLPVLPDPKKPQFFEAIDGRATKAYQAIHLRYATEGFIQARIDNISTQYDTNRKAFVVTIAVIEGDRALVGSIELPTETTQAASPQAPDLKLQRGQPFRIEDYVNDRIALNSYYRDQGYIESKISGILKPADNTIDVIFTADKGPNPRVGEIRKAKPGKTRIATIERAITLKKGDLIHSTELARSRKQLLESRVFQSIDIRHVPSEEDPQIHDLVVDVTEKPEVEVTYGLRYSFERDKSKATTASDDYSAFQIGGSFDILNPFGYGHRYGVSGFFFGKEQFFRAFFETESFFGLYLPTQVYLSDENLYIREISNLRSRIQKITFQQYKKWGEIFESTRWGETLRFQWNYSFRHIVLTPLDEEFNRIETDRGSISLALIGDTRDSFVDPKRGLFWSLSSEFARTWLGSEVNFNKFFSQLYYYFSFGENFTWASGLRLGAVPGDNPSLILEDRFKAGGPNSIRGFPVNSLGPTNSLGEPLGGQAVFIFNQELRFPIYKSFHGGIFYDAGNVFALARQVNFKDMRHCAGLGLRYMLPFGPIRFDWAYVLDPKPGESRSRLVFSIGHAF